MKLSHLHSSCPVSSMRYLLCTSALLLIAFAEVAPFDPFVFFNSNRYDAGSDLLVLIEPAKSLGRSPQYKALVSLDSKQGRGNGLSKRSRGLLLSICRGSSSQYYGKILERWHLGENELPVLLLLPEHTEESGQGKFRLDLVGVDDPLGSVVDFVKAFDAGGLKPWIHSLDKPSAEEQNGPVFEVVGSTFMEEVVEVNVTVVLLLYAPWCGFCRRINPAIQGLGRQLAGANKLVRVARFDISQNDLPPQMKAKLDMRAVPRIYLFRQTVKTAPEMFEQQQELPTTEILQSWLVAEVPGLKEELERPKLKRSDASADLESDLVEEDL